MCCWIDRCWSVSPYSLLRASHPSGALVNITDDRYTLLCLVRPRGTQHDFQPKDRTSLHRPSQLLRPRSYPGETPRNALQARLGALGVATRYALGSGGLGRGVEGSHVGLWDRRVRRGFLLYGGQNLDGSEFGELRSGRGSSLVSPGLIIRRIGFLTDEILVVNLQICSLSPFSVSLFRTRRTWPFNEQVIDVIHKGVYAFTTGYVVDRWLH